MGQVAALIELHAEDPVAGADRAEVGRHVGLGARVRLDVDVLGAGEERQGALLGESLGDVDVLAAAVVALAGQALGVLVGQPAALRLEDGPEDIVLAGDELDLVVLATATLADHRRPQLGIDIGDRGPGESRGGGGGHRDPSVCVRDRPGRGDRRHGPTTVDLGAGAARGRRTRRDRSGTCASVAETVRQLGLVEGRGQDIGRDRALPQDPRRAGGAVDHRRGDATGGRASVQDERDAGPIPELGENLSGRCRPAAPRSGSRNSPAGGRGRRPAPAASRAPAAAGRSSPRRRSAPEAASASGRWGTTRVRPPGQNAAASTCAAASSRPTSSA